jgi:hypothetical protein
VYVCACVCMMFYVFVCMGLYVFGYVCGGGGSCVRHFFLLWFGVGVETCGALCCRLGRRRGRLIGYDVSRKLS